MKIQMLAGWLYPARKVSKISKTYETNEFLKYICMKELNLH